MLNYNGGSKAMAIKVLLSSKLGEVRMKQSELARLTGIRPNTVNDLHNEFALGIKFDHLDLICEALKCDIADLLVRVPGRRDS